MNFVKPLLISVLRIDRVWNSFFLSVYFNPGFTPESLLGLEFWSYLPQVFLAFPKLEFFLQNVPKLKRSHSIKSLSLIHKNYPMSAQNPLTLGFFSHQCEKILATGFEFGYAVTALYFGLILENSNINSSWSGKLNLLTSINLVITMHFMLQKANPPDMLKLLALISYSMGVWHAS